MYPKLNNGVCLTSADSSRVAGRWHSTLAAMGESGQRLRLLVGIASYGNKNLQFLGKIIQQYRGLPMDVDVVVFSESPKDLGSDVKVLVGLPSSNPFSLPFAHKSCFAQNVERYDLFVYSEDDVEVTAKNIQAFLRITPQLKSDEIAGFLRYEEDRCRAVTLPDVHGAYHWKAESVARRGAETIAEFSNEHAGFYILTQNQLRRAIASGGYLVPPYEGRYGMLETAATDPYTCCGFRKVICVSSLNDFLVHHLPDCYAGRLGLPLSALGEQIETLMDIGDGRHSASSLFDLESGILHGRWGKSYYEGPREELLEMVPAGAKTILSVGCGSGAVEVALKQQGAAVTALPLDSVIGVTAARQGVEIVYGSWGECCEQLEGRKFDCVLMANLLHLLPGPKEILQQSVRFVGKNGTLVVGGPNFGRIPILIRRALGRGDYRKLRAFVESGINVYGPQALARHIRSAGFRIAAMRWLNHEISRGSLRRRWINWGRLTAEDWILRAQSNGLRPEAANLLLSL